MEKRAVVETFNAVFLRPRGPAAVSMQPTTGEVLVRISRLGPAH